MQKTTAKIWAYVLSGIILLFFALSFLSCGHLKRTANKQKTLVDSSVSINTVSSSTLTIERDIDTTLLLSGSVLDGIFPAPWVGDTTVLEDSNQRVEVTTTPDGKTWLKSTAKPKSVPVKMHEKTTKRDSSATSQKADVKKEVKTQFKSVDKFQIPWYGYVIAFLFVVFCIVLGVLFRKFK